MTEQQQLITRREQLQQEQTDLRQQLGEWRARLATLTDVRREALKRYDIGHDSAQAEADTALDEIFATEAAIAKAERQLSEYPARMHALNQEIERSGFRDRCKQLLALQQLERDAWHEFTQVLPEFYEAWHAYSQTRTERRALARSLASIAGNTGMTSPPAGDFPAPSEADLQQWLQLKPVTAQEQIAGAMAKAAAAIG